MKLLFINICFLVCLPTFLNSQELDYRKYHEQINKIELQIVDGNYAIAAIKYDSLFKIYPNHFSKDLYNAAVCEIILKNYKKAVEYSELILINGEDSFDYNFLTKRPAFKKIIKTKEWKNLKKRLVEINETAKLSLDSSFIKIRQDLFNKEQDNAKDFVMFYKSVYNSTVQLYNLFTENPNHYLRMMFKGNYFVYSSIIRHYYELFNLKENYKFYEDSAFIKEFDLNKYNLDSLYKYALIKGYVLPTEYAFCHDYKNIENEKILCPFAVWFFKDAEKIFFTMPTDEEIENSNELRKQYGLPCYADDYYKTIKSTPALYNFPMNKFNKRFARLEKDPHFTSKLEEIRCGDFLNEIILLIDEVNKKENSFIFYNINYQIFSEVPKPYNENKDNSLKDLYLQINEKNKK